MVNVFLIVSPLMDVAISHSRRAAGHGAAEMTLAAVRRLRP
jgi:hypothetical protein